MRIRIYGLALWLIVTLCVGCIDAPEYPLEPVIHFISMDKDTLVQDNFDTDWTTLTFGFTDGDGDLGDFDSINVFLIDTRIQDTTVRYKIPFLSQSAGAKAISGEIAIKLNTTCCIFTNGQAPCTPSSIQPVDTIIYDIIIKDRANHYSNVIQSPPIYLLCQ